MIHQLRRLGAFLAILAIVALVLSIVPGAKAGGGPQEPDRVYFPTGNTVEIGIETRGLIPVSRIGFYDCDSPEAMTVDSLLHVQRVDSQPPPFRFFATVEVAPGTSWICLYGKSIVDVRSGTYLSGRSINPAVMVWLSEPFVFIFYDQIEVTE